MALQIPDSDIGLIKAAQHAILLGIITGEGFVRLIESDQANIPGHVEWLERERIDDVVRGFSLLVKNGEVSAVFRLSRLNPTSDAALETSLMVELKALLPLSEECKTFVD